MPNLNKDALDIWNALRPMIDKEIERRTMGMVQRRKAKVTTAPANSLIGVTEAFGTEIFVPYVSSMANAQVGDVVWVEFMYGATNSVVIGFASLDDKDITVAGNLTINGIAKNTSKHCEGSLSQVGWYRVLSYSPNPNNGWDAYGATGAFVNVAVTREGTADDEYINEAHMIDLVLVLGGIGFANETSVTQTMSIDKIRYSVNTSTNIGYIDIHFKRTTYQNVCVCFDVKSNYFTQESMMANAPYIVADSPTGEIIQESYDFAYNT